MTSKDWLALARRYEIVGEPRLSSWLVRLGRTLMRWTGLPKLRARIRRSDDEEAFQIALQKARREKDHPRVEDLKEGRRTDEWFEWEEGEIAASSKLLEEADKYRVPVPERPPRGDANSHWTTSSFGQAYLTRLGFSQVRDAVDDQREKRDARWNRLLNTSTGALGTLAALLAVALTAFTTFCTSHQ